MDTVNLYLLCSKYQVEETCQRLFAYHTENTIFDKARPENTKEWRSVPEPFHAHFLVRQIFSVFKPSKFATETLCLNILTAWSFARCGNVDITRNFNIYAISQTVL